MEFKLAPNKVWTLQAIASALFNSDKQIAINKTQVWLEKESLFFPTLSYTDLTDERNMTVKSLVVEHLKNEAQKNHTKVIFAALTENQDGTLSLQAWNEQKMRWWFFFDKTQLPADQLLYALSSIAQLQQGNVLILPHSQLVGLLRPIAHALRSNKTVLDNGKFLHLGLEIYSHAVQDIKTYNAFDYMVEKSENLTHLDYLEAEAIHIFREVVSESSNPVMLYSVGKDSSVMLHLARKAFYPSAPPFPLLHVDTRWKFQSMYDFRDQMAMESDMELLVHVNPEGIDSNINPFDHGSALHTHIMKTLGLKQALDKYKFDVAFGGARRDEEQSRAKERIFSFRTKNHRWDPKNQRPELWNLYNSQINTGESIRVFPLSNWTELDIWQYIYREKIPLVPLYYAAERPVILRDNMLMMVDDNRLKKEADEKVLIRKIRFRTLGCYPLTGAIESDADDIASIILELLNARSSERQGRTIDSDTLASMEKKKQEGYF